MQQIMIFQIGTEFYGIDIADITEIVEFTRLVSVPRSPVWAEGILNHHGRIVTVLNLSTFFDLPPGQEEKCLRRIAVLNNPLMDIGILLEGPLEVISEWEVKTEMLPDAEFLKGKYINSILVSKGAIVNLLDIDKITADLDGYFTLTV